MDALRQLLEPALLGVGRDQPLHLGRLDGAGQRIVIHVQLLTERLQRRLVERVGKELPEHARRPVLARGRSGSRPTLGRRAGRLHLDLDDLRAGLRHTDLADHVLQAVESHLAPEDGGALAPLTHIVLGRGAPEIGRRSAHEQLPPLIAQRAERPGSLVDHQAQGTALHYRLAGRLGEPQRGHRRDVQRRRRRRRHRHRELRPGHLVARLGPRGGFGERETQRQPELRRRGHVRHRERQGQRLAFAGRRRQPGQPALLHHLAVRRQRPGAVQVAQVGEEVLVHHLDPACRQVHRLHLNRLVDPLELPHAGVDRAVREDHAVDAEGAVVGRVAVIAAIGKPGLALLGRATQALIDPVPDKGPAEARIALDDLPVLPEVPGAVAHRVSILAEDEGALLAGCRRHRHEPLEIRVHRADHVHIGFVVGRFVVHRARGVVGVDPIGERRVVRPVARLVAHRPDHHARVVLVALDHPRAPLHKGGQPRRVPARFIPDAVRLDVRLVDHVEAIFVAEIVPARIVGVVAGTHGVEVEALHQQDVLDHRRHTDRVARVGVVLVAVRAAEVDRHAVDEDLAAADLHLAEAHTVRLDLQNLACRIGERDQQRVEIGILRRPLSRRRSGHRQIEVPLPGVREGWLIRNTRNALGDALLLGVIQRRRHLVPIRRDAIGIGGHVDPNLEVGIAVVGVKLGPNPDVAQVDRRRGVQVDVAVDAAEPPEVLILQVAAVGPAVDPHGERVLTGPQIGRQVELRREPAVLAVADLLAVHPEIEGGIDAVEDDEDPATGPPRGDGEGGAIAAHGVVILGHLGHVVWGKGILDVCVHRRPVALQLPVGGHGDRVPTTGVEVIGIEAIRRRRRVGRPGEGPVTVKQSEESRSVPVATQRGRRVLIRHQRCVGRRLVPTYNLRVLPIIDHTSILR